MNEERQPLLRSTTPRAGEDVADHLPTRNIKAAVFLVAIIVPYFTCYIVCHAEIAPYIYEKIAREYNGSHMSSQRPCSPNMTEENSTASQVQNEIQTRVANLEMYLGFTTYLTATIPVIFIGPLTDHYGRRLGFLFPVVGTCLKVLTYTAIIALDMPLEWFFLAHLFEAFGGGFASMISTMFSVISDVTLPGKRRALHITIMEAMQTVVAAAGQVCVAIWIKSSFLQPLYFAVATGTLALLGAIFFPETNTRHSWNWSETLRNSTGFFKRCLGMPKKSVLLYVYDNHGHLAKRRLCFTVFVLTVAVNFSKTGTWNLYRMKYPLCWSASLLLIFNGLQLIVYWVAILLFLTVARKAFNMADRHIALIGCISNMTSLIFASMATNDTMVYEAAVLGIFVRAIIPMLRSMLSVEVSSDEQGALYAGLGVIETLGVAIFGILFTKLYTATLNQFPGAVFIAYAGLMAVAIVLLGCTNAVARYRRFLGMKYGSVLAEKQKLKVLLSIHTKEEAQRRETTSSDQGNPRIQAAGDT